MNRNSTKMGRFLAYQFLCCNLLAAPRGKWERELKYNLNFYTQSLPRPIENQLFTARCWPFCDSCLLAHLQYKVVVLREPPAWAVRRGESQSSSHVRNHHNVSSQLLRSQIERTRGRGKQCLLQLEFVRSF